MRANPSGGPVPLFVFDAGYDPVQLALDLADIHVATLVRLRKDRCFYADPDPATVSRMGRPPQHGHKFDCTDPASWLPPTAELQIEDPQYGTVRARVGRPASQAAESPGARRQKDPARGLRHADPR